MDRLIAQPQAQTGGSSRVDAQPDILQPTAKAKPMRYSLVLTIGIVAASLTSGSAASAAAPSTAYALGCSLTGEDQPSPVLRLGNTGGALLSAGQRVFVDFASGIKFAVDLPQNLPSGFAVKTQLPDTVGSVPHGSCTARLAG
jgi:hypothetical protein